MLRAGLIRMGAEPANISFTPGIRFPFPSNVNGADVPSAANCVSLAPACEHNQHDNEAAAARLMPNADLRRTAMHRHYDWLPEGDLDKRLASSVALELIKLARSTDPNETDDLIEIAMTQGKQNIRIALEGIALERELARAAEFKKLEWLVIVIAALTFLAAAVQAGAAILS